MFKVLYCAKPKDIEQLLTVHNKFSFYVMIEYQGTTHSCGGPFWWAFVPMYQQISCVNINVFVKGVSRRGVLEDVEDSWPETWRTESSLISWMILFYPKEDTLKISCWYLIRSVSGRGGSWPETWRTGSSLMLWMYLVDLKDHILKVSCHYLYFWLKYKGVLPW